MPKSNIEPARLKGLASKITAAHEAAEQCARDAIGYALEAGRLLVEAKEIVGHGNFGPWLVEHFEFSDSTAQNYMTVARRWPELEAKTQHAGNLSIRGALRLLSSPNGKPSGKPPIQNPKSKISSNRFPGIMVGTEWFRPLDRDGWLGEFAAGIEMAKLAADDAIVVIRTEGSKEATRRADVLVGRWELHPIDWAIVITAPDVSEELVIGYTGQVDIAEWLPHPPGDRSSVVLVKRPPAGIEALVRSWLMPFAEAAGVPRLAHVAGDQCAGFTSLDNKGEPLAA